MITRNGNVGIGTTSPSTNLHVLGDSFSVNPSARITHNPGFSPEFIELSAGAFDGGGIITVGSTSSTIFKRGSNESMRINNSGNVGIGTTSPSAKFHVVGDSESLRLGTTTSDNYFTFFNSSGTQIGDIGYDGRDTNILSIWNNSNGGVLFGANGSERMRITAGGNVGIGTSSPTDKLHVVGTSLLTSDYAGINLGNDSVLMGGKNYSGMYLEDGVASFGYNPGGDFRGVRANNLEGVWFVNESGCKLGLQPVDNNLFSEGNIIQTKDVPSNTTTPAAWIKIYNNDDSSFYFMPVYQ